MVVRFGCLYVVLGGGAVRLVLVVQLHSLELDVLGVFVAVLQVHRSRWDNLDVGSQDVLGGGEFLCGLGSLGADAGLEDGEVGELHGVAVEADLSDASHHVVQQTDDLALRVRAVVSAHVFGDAFEVDDVGVDGAGVELALGVVVRLALVNCVLNHVFLCVYWLDILVMPQSYGFCPSDAIVVLRGVKSCPLALAKLRFASELGVLN